MELHRGRLIDHIQLVVADLGASRRFYEALFEVLDIPIGGERGHAFLVRRAVRLHPRQPRGRGEADRPPPSRLPGQGPRHGRCLLQSGPGRRRPGQWRAGRALELSSRLLRRLPARSRRQQYRGGVPRRGGAQRAVGQDQLLANPPAGHGPDDLRRRRHPAFLPRHPRRPEGGRPARARLQFQLWRAQALLDLFLRHARCGDLGLRAGRQRTEGARERIYIVEPTGEFVDDPNLTDKKFPGNPTKSYRSREPLRITGEVTEWEGHPPERLKEMKDFLARLEAEGDMQIID